MAGNRTPVLTAPRAGRRAQRGPREPVAVRARAVGALGDLPADDDQARTILRDLQARDPDGLRLRAAASLLQLEEPQAEELVEAALEFDVVRREEVKKTERTGHYYDLTLQIAGETEQGTIRVAGMGKAWGKDKSQSLSEDGRAWVNKDENLRRKLLELVRPHLPPAQ